MKKNIALVVFDMAGTTVRDEREVENCFYEAALRSGLRPDRSKINAMQGLPKLEVIETLWAEAVGAGGADYRQKVDDNYKAFRGILEDHYRTHEVQPTEGALATFRWLRDNDIKIALTTGFYREVTNIILDKLGWSAGLDAQYRGGEGALIDLSLTPDETGRGRPHPDMIFKAMEMLGISDAKAVIKIGDTPSDIQAGKAAGCLFSLAVTNGTHSREALAAHQPDGLLASLAEFPDFVAGNLAEIAV